MDGILGEIRAFAGTYAPQNWMLCNGSVLSINSYQTLYSLIGTYYGGDGVNTFAIPDLRGRLATGQGQGPALTNRVIGSFGGAEQEQLALTEMPGHNHIMNVCTDAANLSVNQPTATTFLGSVGAASGTGLTYVPAVTPKITKTALNGATIQPFGGNAPHKNVMPCVAINYIICVAGGVFPQRP